MIIVLLLLRRLLQENLKINGRFWEREEKIFVSKQRPGASRHYPQYQRALVGTRQAVSRHTNLPLGTRNTHSIGTRASGASFAVVLRACFCLFAAGMI